MTNTNAQAHHDSRHPWRIEYPSGAMGGAVTVRYFATKRRAQQWAGQVGVIRTATIAKVRLDSGA